MSVTLACGIAAFVCIIASAAWKVPLWVGTLLLCIAFLLTVWTR